MVRWAFLHEFAQARRSKVADIAKFQSGALENLLESHPITDMVPYKGEFGLGGKAPFRDFVLKILRVFSVDFQLHVFPKRGKIFLQLLWRRLEAECHGDFDLCHRILRASGAHVP